MPNIYRINPIVEVQKHDDINPNILYSRPENIDHSHGWSVSADYSYTSNRINLSAFATIEGSYIKYPYMNEIKSYNKIAAFLMGNFAYKFYKDYDFYMSAYYQSPYINGNNEIGYTLGVNCGVSAKFFDKKLYVSVDVNDIFRKSVTPYWESHTYDTDYWRKNEYDTRGVVLKIRYTFNSIRTNFKQKSGNQDLLNRTND